MDGPRTSGAKEQKADKCKQACMATRGVRQSVLSRSHHRQASGTGQQPTGPMPIRPVQDREHGRSVWKAREGAQATISAQRKRGRTCEDQRARKVARRQVLQVIVQQRVFEPQRHLAILSILLRERKPELVRTEAQDWHDEHKVNVDADLQRNTVRDDQQASTAPSTRDDAR